MSNGSLSLQKVSAIVAGGSADSVLAVAALLRHNYRPDQVEICFLSPQSYNHIPDNELAKLVRNTIGRSGLREVLIVGLPAIESNLKRTAHLIRSISSCGNIIGVLDEHNAEAWKNAFRMAGAATSFDRLAIQPVSGKRRGNADPYSAGGLLLSLLGASADTHIRDLCAAAEAADLARYSGNRIAYEVNACLKAVPKREKKTAAERRDYLARHFACTLTPDKKILSWVSEYEKEIGPGNTLALEQASEEGEKSVIVCDIGDRRFDANYIFGELFSRGHATKYVLMKYLEEGIPRVILRVSPRVNRDAGMLLRCLGIRYTGGLKRVFFPAEHLDQVVRVLGDRTYSAEARK